VAAAVRVLLADDHRLFAETVRAILDIEPAMEVVGVVTTGEDAIEQQARLAADVVLMDISMPGLGGIEATRRIREQSPGAHVIVLTGSESQHDIAAARDAGASAYVTKDRIAVELIRTIRQVTGS
jgi:DNA-binding NarL/FixJ family response regulator